MAMAVVEALGIILRGLSFLGRVLRAYSFFEDINKVRKIKRAILAYKDIKELTTKTKKVKDYVLNQLFELQLKSNKFIFFSEKELIDFVKSRDSNAKILKLLETKEIDLFLVEGKVFSREWEGLLNYFTFALLMLEINNFENNVLIAIQNAYNDIHNELLKIKRNIINKLNEEKQNDINNTYCLKCSCCCGCSCDKGSCSCCCSCQCNLIHYTQSWDNLKSYIETQFNDFDNYIHNRLIEDEQNSLKAIFIMLFNALMQFFFTRVKEKYLFAVIKEKEILRELKKEKHKTGVMRVLYEYLRHKKGKYEYNKLIKEIQEYLLWKLNKKYSKKQIITLLHTVKYRYMEDKIYIYKDKHKKYVIIE